MVNISILAILIGSQYFLVVSNFVSSVKNSTIFSCTYWLSIHLLWGEVSTHIVCPFLMDRFISLLSLRVVYRFCTLLFYQIYDFKIFFSVCGMAFYSPNSSPEKQLAWISLFPTTEAGPFWVLYQGLCELQHIPIWLVETDNILSYV